MKLASENLIDNPTNFNGNKTLTRYEAAKFIAKLLAKKTWNNKPNFKKLVAEFSDELSNFGVKLDFLEEKIEEIKITNREIEKKLKNSTPPKYRLNMEARIRFEDNNFDLSSKRPAGTSDGTADHDIRTRINISANIDENVKGYFSFQDDSKFSSIKQNNGATNTKGNDRNLFLAYVDIKNPTHDIKNIRIGRQTIKLGYGMVQNGELDGLLLSMKKNSINYSLGGFKIDSIINKKSVLGSGTNDGLNFKFITADRSWQKYSLQGYVASVDQMERKSTLNIAGEGNLTYWGIGFDGEINDKLTAFFEYNDKKMDNYGEYSNGNPLNRGVKSKEDGEGYKLGIGWQFGRRYDLSFIYQKRGKDFMTLSHNDDYSDSLFYNDNSTINNEITPSVMGGVTTFRDNYNNSKIISVILGAQFNDKLTVDLWFEQLTGDLVLSLPTDGLTGNYDQSVIQLILTYQYKTNTAFKMRYRSVKFDKNDPDYKLGVTKGQNPADYNQLRMDMITKF
jgi:hypothetical protein